MVRNAPHYTKSGVVGRVPRVKLIPISNAPSDENSTYLVDPVNRPQDSCGVLLDLLRKQGISDYNHVSIGPLASFIPCADEIAGIASATNKWIGSHAYIQRWRGAKVFDRKSEISGDHIGVNYLKRQFYPTIYAQPWALAAQGGIFHSICGFFRGIGAIFQGMELQTVDDSLRERCNRKREREYNQSNVEIVPIADKNYKLLGFSEEFSNADDEFKWRWLPLGIAGFVCFVWGLVICHTKSLFIGMLLYLVGWVCGVIGFICWFN